MPGLCCLFTTASCRLAGGGELGGVQGGAYDAGLVEVGRHQRGSGLNLVDELVELGGAAAAQDEEVGENRNSRRARYLLKRLPQRPQERSSRLRTASEQ